MGWYEQTAFLLWPTASKGDRVNRLRQCEEGKQMTKRDNLRIAAKSRTRRAKLRREEG